MSLLDPGTGEYSSAAYGLDTSTASITPDAPSLFDSIGNVITKAVPLTAMSVVNSFANTAIAVGNIFGADVSPISVEGELSDLGWNEYSDYYQQHSQGIEAAGFLAGSLVPGLGAVKLLKLAQLGKMGPMLGRATSLMSGPRDAIIRDAVGQMEQGPASLFGLLGAAKYKALALTVGDNALQALAFETAVAGTMNQAPLMQAQDLGEITTNMFYGVLLGAGVGGMLENIWSKGLISTARVNADLATKSSELSTRFRFAPGSTFRGIPTAGDETALLLHSLDQIPQDVAFNLAQKKGAFTTDAGVLAAKKSLATIVGQGNEEVSSAFFDAAMRMRAAGQPAEDFYNEFSGLAKISRHTSEPVTSSVPDGSTFFINRFARGTSYSLEDLFTSAPLEGADLSQKYALRQYETAPVIAKATDTYTDAGGKEVAKYLKATDAWQDGADIFINARAQIVVNPNAPNLTKQLARAGEGRVLTAAEERIYRATGQIPETASPLTGASVILNTVTGEKQAADQAFNPLSKSASPAVPAVVGDYGQTTLLPVGLQYGKKVSLQSASSPLGAETATEDANARYVWASIRGIKPRDTIDPSDIPMMEQLYREASVAPEGFIGYVRNLEKRGVTLTTGDDLPLSSNDLLNQIRGAKDDLIHDVISANPKMSSEEVAIRANVPEKYLADSFQASAPEGYMVDPKQWRQVNHVRLEYDIGNTQTQDGMILRGYLDSQNRINAITAASKSAMATELGSDWEQFLAKDVSSADATFARNAATSVKAGFVTFANSNYGTIGQVMERIGRFVTNEIQKRMAGYSEVLRAPANAIRNDLSAASELGGFIAVRRRTGETFSFLPPDLAAKYWRTPDTAVLTNSLVRDAKGNVVDWNAAYTPDNFLPGAALAGQLSETSTGTAQQLHTFYDLSPKVAAFERAHAQLNDARITSRNAWYSAQGVAREQQTGTLYAPPIDTSKYKYFAYVKAKAGTAFSDDDTAMITAETAALLDQKIAALRPDYSIYTKDLVADFHKAEGDYLYNRNFADSRVNSALARRGILNDIFPDTAPDTIIPQYVDFHQRQTTRLVRDYVELGNNQLFAELSAMGERFTGSATSTTGGYLSKLFSASVEDPYKDYINTALAVSPREQYRLWNGAQEKVEAFADTAFRQAKDLFRGAAAGKVSFEEATAQMESMGITNGYKAATDAMGAYYNIANRLPPSNILSKIVSTANMITSATAIRLDIWQSAINIISSPILTMGEGRSLRGYLLNNPELSTVLPDGTGRVVPSVTKAMFGAVRDMWNPNMRAEYFPLLMRMGIIKENSNEYYNMINNLQLPLGRGVSESKILGGLQDAVDTASKFTGSQWTENAVRMMAAFTSLRIQKAAGVAGQDLIDNMATFVNRVHGNYIASQRPIAFQGPIGQAMGLFQTYQLNMFQQLFRYVEEGEGKTLALMAALQGGIFGGQSLPGVQMLNQHLVGNAAGNIGHKDIYGTTTSFFDKGLGDWLLYGAASNVLGVGLYSRGDINPRQISVLPINPLDYPAVSGAVNFLSNLWKTTDRIVQGGRVTDSIMLGMEHNGISRPLSGLGQLMQGYVSDQKGELVSATRPQAGTAAGWSDIISAANFGRLAGARPIDEAIAMDALYRRTAYETKDTARMERLGEAVKSGLTAGTPLDTGKLDQFTREYVNAGGQINHFGQTIMKWAQEANVSKANEMFRHLAEPVNQQLQLQMGGVPLPDFQNRGTLTQLPQITTPSVSLGSGGSGG